MIANLFCHSILNCLSLVKTHQRQTWEMIENKYDMNQWPGTGNLR